MTIIPRAARATKPVAYLRVPHTVISRPPNLLADALFGLLHLLTSTRLIQTGEALHVAAKRAGKLAIDAAASNRVAHQMGDRTVPKPHRKLEQSRGAMEYKLARGHLRKHREQMPDFCLGSLSKRQLVLALGMNPKKGPHFTRAQEIIAELAELD